ncbi:MAG: Bifunctional uridylyltransferase/uridylyl-removing enzyme [Actinomycetota bacterium]
MLNYQQLRSTLIAADISATAENMAALVAGTEQWLQELAAALPASGMALVAVGGFGRRELVAGSDLDLLLLHEPKLASEAAAVADKIWYPIWDAGLKLDHSVRDVAGARALAGNDFKVILGLLDSRVIAGDAALFEKLRSSALTDWRASAPKRLPELFEDVQARRQRVGDIAHLLEPDLKDAYGGLRDITVLRAIAASWITDFDHATIKPAGAKLLEIRDALHRVSGRPSDRLTFHEQAAVAALQGFANDDALLREVSLAGRAIAQASDLAWYRVQRQTVRRGIRRLEPRRDRRPLADGVVEQNGEVVLARDVEPAADPTLFLRVAAAAAQAGLPLAPHTVSRLAAEYRPLPVPWPSHVRNTFVSLLGSGPALLPVWEALDQAGMLTQWLPHWERIRSAPQRNALHQFTVDRHSIETVVQAATLTREVDRPDLLLVGALLHDIGKAQGPGHSEIGEKLIRQIAPTLGFGVRDTEILATLVLHHLLLAEVATTRDLDDPATIKLVADAVGTIETLQLLRQLTEADSKATNEGIWTDWKAKLVDYLVKQVSGLLDGGTISQTESFIKRSGMLDMAPNDIVVAKDASGIVVRICLTDRVGLIAHVAGVWALNRLEVVSAEFETLGGLAYQEWLLRPSFGEHISETELTEALQRGLADAQQIANQVASLHAPRQSRRGFKPAPTRIKVLPNAATNAAVLEVRAHDEPGLLYKLCQQIAAAGFNIVAARISTLGSEVVDAIYIQNADGGMPTQPELEALTLKIQAITD